MEPWDHGTIEPSNQKSQMDQEYGLLPADARQQLRRRRRTFKKYSGILFLLIQSFMTTILAVLNYVECLLFSFFQNMNTSGFRACVKELYANRYDPLSVGYAVLTGL